MPAIELPKTLSVGDVMALRGPARATTQAPVCMRAAARWNGRCTIVAEGPMATTRKLKPEEYRATFEEFTKRHLREAEDVTIEVLSPDIGDQLEARDARLLGITWDEKDRVLEVLVEG